jgi:dTDP-glucose 4,6-dehydratase
MNILVTGACGFIGSHLVEELVRQKHKVTAFVFYNSRNSKGWLDTVDKDILNNLEIVSGDIRDDEIIFQNSKKKDIIFHLAALIGIPYSYKAVKSYIDTNINGTYNILNSAKKSFNKPLLPKYLIRNSSKVLLSSVWKALASSICCFILSIIIKR